MWLLFSRKTRRSQTSRPAGRRPGGRPRLEVLEDRWLLSAGALDPTFNPAGSPPGTATVLINPYLPAAYCALAQPSGKIVLAGESETSNLKKVLSLAEFAPNGSLDPTFGSGGIVTLSTSGAPFTAYDAVLYPTGTAGDGKILAVGPANNSTFALARFNPDGSLDTSFGHNGIVNTSFKQGSSGVDSVALVPNGTSPPKIVMAGSAANNAGIELARYNPDGSLDTSFGTKGTVYQPISGGISVSGLAFNPVSGDLIVAGGPLVAFRPNGSLDSAFGTGGVVSTGITGGAISNQFGLAIYPANDPGGNASKIVVGGGSGIARYTVTGTLDTTWGGTGLVTSVPGVSLAIQADGKVVASSEAWSVARLNPDGSLESSFGTGGIATAGLGNPIVPRNKDVVIEPNGDILQAGTAHQLSAHTDTVFAVARYLSAEPVIGSFTASQSGAGAPVTLTAANVTDANPNSTVTQVAFYYYDGAGNKVSLGTATAADGSGHWSVTVSLPPGTYTIYAQATDRYGVLGEPVAFTFQVL